MNFRVKQILIILMSFLFVGCDLIFFDEEKVCQELIESYKMFSFRGEVVKKYIDIEDHSYEKLLINGEKENIRNESFEVVLNSDTTYIINHIKQGDYIEKNTGELKIKVIRGQIDSVFQFKFSCPEKYY